MVQLNSRPFSSRLRRSAWLSALVFASCSASLDDTLEHRRCTDEGTCVSGYVCSEDHICVRTENVRMDPITTPRAPRAGTGSVSGRDASMPDDVPLAGKRATGVAGNSSKAGSTSVGTAGGTAGAGSAGSSSEAGANPGGSGQMSAGASGSAGESAAAGASGAPQPSAAGSAGMPPMSTAGTSSEPQACASGTRCDGACVELDRDPNHCGACDRRCEVPNGAGARCESGMCVVVCTASEMLCDDACVDVATSEDHCGSCGNRCNGNRSCERGTCTKQNEGGTIDVAELEVLLAVFGVSLEEFARAIGVPVSKLDEAEIQLSDLGSVGITVAALALLGFSEDALELIGIDVDLD